MDIETIVSECYSENMQARNRSFEHDEALGRAMLLFWRKGYGASSARNLVSETGLSTSSLSLAFGGKRDLFEASLKKYRAEQSIGLIEALGADAPLRQKLRMIFLHTVTQSLESACKGCLMVNTAVEFGAQDPEIRGLVVDNVHEVEDALTFAIDAARSGSEALTPLPSRSLARLIFHMLTALKVTSKVKQDRAWLEDAVNSFLTVVFGPEEGNHGSGRTDD
jgi:TetR/AcrR family transcriptional regulator, transcriptional repressor for nem operon